MNYLVESRGGEVTTPEADLGDPELAREHWAPANCATSPATEHKLALTYIGLGGFSPVLLITINCCLRRDAMRCDARYKHTYSTLARGWAPPLTPVERRLSW
jgi:hypothetical protein